MPPPNGYPVASDPHPDSVSVEPERATGKSLLGSDPPGDWARASASPDAVNLSISMPSSALRSRPPLDCPPVRVGANYPTCGGPAELPSLRLLIEMLRCEASARGANR